MKNNYCDLSREQIKTLPERFQGFMLSPFQYNVYCGMVSVPEDSFKEMIDIIAEYAVLSASAQAAAEVRIDIEAIRQIADELELEAQAYEGDFADTVNGCADALRNLIGNPAVPAGEDKAVGQDGGDHV